ncbi:helix-turn-helix domain-containing protein [Chryseobacterium indologenes]|uniref:helix-turn-helix domain-containing protein n=1 Tax=Chryseobacterium indologenes TaxID=253 RepID=UPI001108BAD5|nr:helix-turn-helix domain-containing protein [Chryseobacterium indologenes]MBF6642812.1 helix-turn-helix domain-containing protein [Chryseobacterium indologenes]MEB4762367.1 helix-turn-helix domain-containing protein [Chryseobacterium indologenes]QQQ69140.1 helix-turn-helix domain-containing protein [Chryseobacterium indologenes]TLX23952.1 helix-turn-helix domain-containing protein [Chryseobacterium indologenes]
MSAIQFIGTTPSELIREIKEEIIPELKQQLSKEFQPKEPCVYLSRNEVCEMLQVDLSTLHRWRKDGTLIAYGLGNRVYFKRNEIDELLNRNRLK